MESGVPTYARFPSPEPPYLGEKDIPPISGIGYHRKLPNNNPLSRENGKTHAAPLCIRVGGGGGSDLQTKNLKRLPR